MTLWNTCLVILPATYHKSSQPKTEKLATLKINSTGSPIFFEGLNFFLAKESQPLQAHMKKEMGVIWKQMLCAPIGKGKVRNSCVDKGVLWTCTLYYPWPWQWNSVVFLHRVIIPLNISCIDSDTCTKQVLNWETVTWTRMQVYHETYKGGQTSANPFLLELSDWAKWPVSDMTASGCTRRIYSPMQACSTSAQPFHHLSYSGHFMDLLW